MPAPDPSVIVNIATGISGGGNSLAIGFTPTAGNYLIVMGTRNGSVAAHTAASGWTRHAFDTDAAGFVNPSIIYKQVVSETSTITPWTNGGIADPWVVFEVTSLSPFTIISSYVNAEFVTIDPPSATSTGSPGVLLMFAVGRNQDVVPVFTNSPMNGAQGSPSTTSRYPTWAYVLLDEDEVFDPAITWDPGVSAGPYAVMMLLLEAEGASEPALPRVTQLAALTVFEPEPQPVRVSQLVVMEIVQVFQPMQVTQLPSLQAVILADPHDPRPLQPEYPVIERWTYATVVTRSGSNREQRAGLRSRPKQFHQFRLPIVEEEDRRELFHLLFRYAGNRVRLPAYQYATVVEYEALTGATAIVCDVLDANLYENAQAALLDNQFRLLGYVEVASVTTNSVELTSPLEFDVPQYSWIAWAPTYRMPDNPGMSTGYPQGVATVELEVVDDVELVNPVAPSTTLTMLDDLVLLPEPFGVSDVNEGFARGVDTLDNGLVTPVDYSIWRNTLISQTRAYQIELEEITNWKAFAEAVQGSQKSFLLPSFRNDLRLASTPALGATQLVTDDHGFREYMKIGTSAYKYLRLETENGVIYRRVLGITEDLNTGNPTIFLNGSIGSNPGDNDFTCISLVYLCRLVKDEIALEIRETYGIVTFSIQAVNE